MSPSNRASISFDPIRSAHRAPTGPVRTDQKAGGPAAWIAGITTQATNAVTGKASAKF